MSSTASTRPARSGLVASTDGRSRAGGGPPSSAGRLRSLVPMSVATRIGHRTETPMPCGRSSRLNTSARATTPYLATQYGPGRRWGRGRRSST